MGGVQASHTDACTPFCFPKNRNSHVRTSPCTIQKTYRAIRQALVSLGLTANAVTVIGAIGTIVVAFATGITGWLFAGAVVLTLLVLADSLDGSIAALTTGGTQFGAFFGFHIGPYR